MYGFNQLNVIGSNTFNVGGSLQIVAGYRSLGVFMQRAVITHNFNLLLDGDISTATIEGGSVGGNLTVTGSGGQKTLQVSTTVGGDLNINCTGAGDAYYFQNAPWHVFRSMGK